VDSRVIRETGGSSNVSVRMPEVDALIDQAILETDVAKRNQIWGQIDRMIMENAVIIPGIYSKSLVLRGKGLTNVFVNEAYGMYDYLSLGVASS
jgi:peptide/nickel transport system substrate-binding protein